MPPPGFDHLSLEEVIEFFEDLIEQEEQRYAKKRRRGVLGVRTCEPPRSSRARSHSKRPPVARLVTLIYTYMW